MAKTRKNKISKGPKAVKHSGRPNIAKGSKGKAGSGYLGIQNVHWLIICLAITLIAYLPSFDNEFTNWDDDKYVTENPIVKNWDEQTIKRIFSEPVSSNYHPLTVLSFAVNYQLAGDDTFSYHLVNLLFHLLNIALVFYLIFILSGRKTGMAVFTAILFGIHPMHVESVAWISERKDVLFTSFFLLSMLAYIQYLSTKSIPKYFIGLFFFVLSLLSKPAAVTLPVVLLLLHYYYKKPLNKKHIAGLIPFFLGSLAIGLTTILFQSETAIQSSATDSMAYKLLFACYGFIMYIVKLFVPYQLNHFYPYPKIENGLPIIFYITPLLTIASLVWVWIKRHNRILVFGFLFYIINIALVLQVLQVGWAVMAERYTYVPYIGLFFILAYGVDSFINRLNNPLHKRLSLAATGLIILGFAFLSFQRVDVWQDSRTLWSDNLSKTPNSTAYNNLANFYIGLNKPDSSVIFYNRALEIDPSHSKAHKNLGVVYIFQKKYDAAISHLKQAIALSPTYTNAYLQLGKAYINKQQYNNALEPLNHYIRQMPNDAYAYNARAMCYHLSGNPSMAVPDYNLAIKNNQGNGLYYYNRAQALESLGRKKEALSDALKAKSLGHKFDESFIKRLQ